MAKAQLKEFSSRFVHHALSKNGRPTANAKPTVAQRNIPLPPHKARANELTSTYFQIRNPDAAPVECREYPTIVSTQASIPAPPTTSHETANNPTPPAAMPPSVRQRLVTNNIGPIKINIVGLYANSANASPLKKYFPRRSH